MLRKWTALALAALVVVMAGSAGPAGAKSKVPGLQFLGQAIVPTGTTFAGHDGRRPLEHHATTRRAASTTRSRTTRASSSRRASTRSRSTSPTDTSTTATSRSRPSRRCRRPDGQPFAPFSLDPEGPDADEGRRARSSRPRASRTRLIDAVGAALLARRDAASASCRCRRAFLPNAAATHGVRQNLALRERAACRRTAASSSSARRARSCRTARPRRLTTGSPSRHPALQPADRHGSTASTSTGPTRSPSRPCRRRTSPSTASSSCCRSTTSSCSRWSARSRSARPDTGNTIKLYSVKRSRARRT